MNVRYVTLAAATALLATTAAGATAPNTTAPKPKISMQSARAKALAYVPHGTIKSAELETEHGKLIYSFDIVAPKKTGVEEVQISALNGKLVSRKHETAKNEKTEAVSEAKEKAPK